MAIAVVDLPEPDSPTIASVSPPAISRSTPSTACTTPSVVEVDGEVPHLTAVSSGRAPRRWIGAMHSILPARGVRAHFVRGSLYRLVTRWPAGPAGPAA